MTAPFLRELADEVRRGQHEESIALHPRSDAACCRASDHALRRGLRLRATDGDLDASIADFRAAAAAASRPDPPQPRARPSRAQRAAGAKASFQRYLELDRQAPDADDQDLLEESMAPQKNR